jgi:hypothetical protein
MARPKSNKQAKTINFEKEVFEALNRRVPKQKQSSFVNYLVRQKVMSEYEFHRQMARQHAAKLAEEQHLMDSAPDKPTGTKHG